MASQKVCHYEKYGYCKMKDDCLYFHPKELCEKEQCDVKSCRQRHPQICKFFALGACKFLDTCKFDHSRIEDNNECKLKLKKLEEKIDTLEKLSKNQEMVIEELKERIKKLDSEMIPVLNDIIRNSGTNKDKESYEESSEDVQCKNIRLESTTISEMDGVEECVDESRSDDSIFDDMNYKNILLNEIKIISELDGVCKDVKINLKIKKISNTVSSLKNIEELVNKNLNEMKLVEEHHRHKDDDEFNVYKILKEIKRSIGRIESLPRNKFQKLTEEELNKVLDELQSARINKEMMCNGIYDISRTELDKM